MGAPLQVCADGPTVPGIDVSVYQADIDWQAVADSGVVFAFIRVSNGTGTPDTRFVENWSEAAAAGVLRGVYQYFRPGQDAIAQADLLLDALDEHGAGELPPVVDVEQTDGESAESVAAQVALWMDRVEAELGVRPIIYTGSYFWNDSVSTDAFAPDPLWIAHWGVSCPNLPDAWSDWVFWQTSATGSVPGITGDVDLDVFNGNMDALLAFADPGGCADCSAPEPLDAGSDATPDAAPDAAADFAAELDAGAEPDVAAGSDASDDGALTDVMPLPDASPEADADASPPTPGRFGQVPEAGLDSGGCRTAPGYPPLMAVLIAALLMRRRS